MTAISLAEIPASAGPRAPRSADQRPALAHVIRDDAEAVAVAKELAAEFARGAAERDRKRTLPQAEIERFSQSGLWGITVPREHGGAVVSNVTLAEVVEIISAADPSIGQIPQNHLYMVEALRLDGTEAAEALLLRPGPARHPLRQRLLRVRHQVGARRSRPA